MKNPERIDTSATVATRSHPLYAAPTSAQAGIINPAVTMKTIKCYDFHDITID